MSDQKQFTREEFDRLSVEDREELLVSDPSRYVRWCPALAGSIAMQNLPHTRRPELSDLQRCVIDGCVTESREWARDLGLSKSGFYKLMRYRCVELGLARTTADARVVQLSAFLRSVPHEAHDPHVESSSPSSVGHEYSVVHDDVHAPQVEPEAHPLEVAARWIESEAASRAAMLRSWIE